MPHWSQLGIRNWRVRPGRTAGGLAAIALGVGVVVWVTCAYESVRRALEDPERGLGKMNLLAADEVLQQIAAYSSGDARSAYNVLEVAAAKIG